MELSHVCHSEVFYGAVSHGCAIVDFLSIIRIIAVTVTDFIAVI